MKHFIALVAIVASCWLCTQATDPASVEDLIRKDREAKAFTDASPEEKLANHLELAIPIAEKILNETNTVDDRHGRPCPQPPGPIPGPSQPSFGSSLINILLQLLISIRTNCAYQPYNLPTIPSPDIFTCAKQCRANPSCTHFTYKEKNKTCHRASSLLSITANIQITLLPASQKCHCGYLLDRASPSGLLSLNALIGALIA